jgi:predicted HD phosphohydrolase
LVLSEPDLEKVLLSLEQVVDGEEPVNELDHALQCAQHARDADSPPDLVVAALLHDVARAPAVGGAFPGLGHDQAGERWLRPRFGERIAWLVGAHVAAKLYLIDNEPDYLALLSSESVRSSIAQRAGASDQRVSHPWWPEALKLRRFDDAAKDPKAPRPDLGVFLDLAHTLEP